MDQRTKTLNAARKQPGSHAGPHGSFPITDAKSVRSAWDLAGHAASPGHVRQRIKHLAEQKGLAQHLPSTARHQAQKARGHK